jgi:nuclear pore complex protein Nup54
MLYNFVDHASAYEKPGNVHPVLWQQAVAQNPDPSRLVPVEAKGFADLKERAESQDVATRKHIEVLNGISDVLRSLRQRHEVSTLSKLEQYTKRHHDLSRRLIALQRKLELIAARGQGIGANEEAFASHVATLLSRLSRPDQFAGRLSQLAADARLRAVGADDATLAQTELPAEALDDICEALQHMTSGISVLTKTLEKDIEDLHVIESGMAHLAPSAADNGSTQASNSSNFNFSRW